MSDRLRYMIYGVLVALSLAVGAYGGLQVYYAFNQLRFNTQMIEVIRQAVIEKHPELAQPQAVEAPPSTPEG